MYVDINYYIIRYKVFIINCENNAFIDSTNNVSDTQ